VNPGMIKTGMAPRTIDPATSRGVPKPASR